jgi:hypothetical protein
VFVDSHLTTYGGGEKWGWSAAGKGSKVSHGYQFLSFASPDVAYYAKSRKGDICLVHRVARKDPHANADNGWSCGVYILNKGNMPMSFFHSAGVEAAAVSADGDFAFTAGGDEVIRWTTTAVSHGVNENRERKRGSFKLHDSDMPIEMACSADGQIVAVAMNDGRALYAVGMKDPRSLTTDTTVVAEKSAKITNHSLTMSDDGRFVFLAQDRLTNTSETVHEVMLVGPDTPYKQLLARKAEIRQVKLTDQQTLVCLDAAGWLGFLSLESGSTIAEPRWLKTELSDPKDFLVSGDGKTVVVRDSKALVIYQRNGSKTVAGN